MATPIDMTGVVEQDSEFDVGIEVEVLFEDAKRIGQLVEKNEDGWKILLSATDGKKAITKVFTEEEISIKKENEKVLELLDL